MTVRTNDRSRADSDATRRPGSVVGRARLRAQQMWEHRVIAWGVALGTPAVYGVLTGVWTPRGPHTTLEVFAAMLLALGVGHVVGWALTSRWAMLISPGVFVGVFELVRLGTAGPTVDGIHLGSELGIVAFLTGRGVHGLLVLLPMVLGAAIGAGLARRTASEPPAARTGVQNVALWLRRSVAIGTGLVLLALAGLVARPATTDPILTADGEPVPGSVAELTELEISGQDLALMVRGRSVDNPVLLFLAGGPGGSELGAMRRHSEALEDDFVVVTLDQRGTGKSFPALAPTSTLTLDHAVADAIEVAEHLRERFGQEKVYLVGQSWGSLLGVLVAQERPDLVHAFVGVGQMVSPSATDRIYYRDTLAWARETGNTSLAETLRANGPPPYADARLYDPVLSSEHELYPYDHSGNSEGAGQMGENIFVEEYSFMEKAHVFAGVLETLAVLYPRIQHVDLREQADRLEVPVYLAQGAHETPGRTGPALEWFELLDAPSKDLVVFDTSGHRPLWEQPEEFHELMTEQVLAETSAR
jgi:pimeloyl-ACP methyl ester carboxylesterase